MYKKDVKNMTPSQLRFFSRLFERGRDVAQSMLDNFENVKQTSGANVGAKSRQEARKFLKFCETSLNTVEEARMVADKKAALEKVEKDFHKRKNGKNGKKKR